MSTTATIADPNTSIAIGIKPELVTFAVFAETVEVKEKNPQTGEDITTLKTTLRHTSSDKEIEKAKTANTLLFEQSVTSYKVGTEAGFAELIPDAEERVNIINRGLGNKFAQKIKATLTEADDAGNPVFQPVEGAWDSKELLQEAAQRRNLSPIEKAMKFVSGLDEDTKNAFLAMLAAQTQAQ